MRNIKTFRQVCMSGAAIVLGLLTAPPAYASDFYAPAQGWSRADMKVWYSLSQGSRLVPVSWLNALKTPQGAAFSSREAMEAYGYVYAGDGAWPAGFVIDQDKNGRDWLGLNCSACHTSKLTANGAEIIVHGGQAMADFQSYTSELTAAVKQARETVFTEFAAQVLGSGRDAESDAALKADLDNWLALRERVQGTSAASHWGRGRADAVGVILATTAVIVAPDSKDPLPQSNAPVSFPHIWNTNQQGRLQHNGIVDNGQDMGIAAVAKMGSLIRNWTEAMGVFAQVTLAADGKSATSSINFANLLTLEQVLAKLQSPRWPEAFGAIDKTSQARAKIYAAECASCHSHLAPEDTQTFLPLYDAKTKPATFVTLTPLADVSAMTAMQAAGAPRTPTLIGTDPAMACNALLHSARAGRFAGQPNQAGITKSDADPKFGEYAMSTDLLRVLMLADMGTRKAELMQIYLANQVDSFAGRLLSMVLKEDGSGYGASAHDPKAPGSVIDQFLGHCADDTVRAVMRNPLAPLPVYKARPLNGIWASPPYLHNGSVPTLYDLLLPQEKRPARFGYFDGAYDVEKGGLLDRAGQTGATVLEVFGKDGQAILGNWNGGHDYGTTLDDDGRRDLVAYLKGL